MHTLKRHARGHMTVIQVLGWLRQVDPWGSKTCQPSWINEPQVTVRVFVSGIPRWMSPEKWLMRVNSCLAFTYIPTLMHLHHDTSYIIHHTHAHTHTDIQSATWYFCSHIIVQRKSFFVVYHFPTLNSSSTYNFISEVSCRQHTVALYFYFLYI